jgi:integrase/recombinase XerD
MTTESLPVTTDLARLLKRYFYSFLINQRRVSKHTVSAYRDTFRLFLPYVATQQNKCASALSLVDISAAVVISFLQYLEDQRSNKVQTRNARLTAIRSFLRYAATEAPDLLADIQPVLAIPEKRMDRFAFEYLNKAEMDALLNMLDLTTWFGRRDHALLITLYNTGARVSEIVKLQVKDVDLQRQHAIHLHGKGRKERIIPLWPQTVIEIKKWLVELATTPNSPLFPNRYGEALTRFGIKQRLDCAVTAASKSCPSLKGRKISPHSIRHTTAMHLLQSGVDLTVIALWLGHEKLETTHQYMEANIEMKRAALAMLPPIEGEQKLPSDVVTDDLLVFLENL